MSTMYFTATLIKELFNVTDFKTDIDLAIDSPILANPDNIFKIAKHFINFGYDGELIIINTPKGTPIDVEIFNDDDYDPEAVEFFNNLFSEFLLQNESHVWLLENSSYHYNCHGYAFHTSETNQRVWMEVPSLLKYWEDKSYIQVENESDATKVEYWWIEPDKNEPSHSAVTTSIPGRYISKWGPCALYLHDKYYCGIFSAGEYDEFDLKYYAPTKIYGQDYINENELLTFWAHPITNATYEWITSQNIVIENIDQNFMKCKITSSLYKPWIEVKITNRINNQVHDIVTTRKILTFKEKLQILIFPNPTSDYLKINICEKETGQISEIFNNIAIDIQISNSFNIIKVITHHDLTKKINISDLPGGLYVIQINSNGINLAEQFQIIH